MSTVELKSFLDAARSVQRDAHIRLNDRKTGATASGGRIVRWIGNFRASSNRRATSAFAESLRSRYGEELTGLALKSAGLDGAGRGGRPLKARHVRAAVRHAQRLEARFQERNAEVARQLVGHASGGQGRQRLFAEQLKQVVRKLLPHSAFMAERLDAAAVAQKVNSAILAAGRGGSHFVTTEESGEILERVATEELDAVWESLAETALAKLSLEEAGSLARQAFDKAAAESEGAQGLRFDQLSLGARESLAHRLQMGAVYRFREWDEEGLDLLLDESRLAAEVDRLAQDFVRERVEARNAVNTLPLPAQVRTAIADQALHETVDPRLAFAFGKAYSDVQPQLGALGQPNGGALALQQPLAKIHQAMEQAVELAEFEVGIDNQNATHCAFWRMMLAPHGRAQANAVAANMGAGQGLRELHEGVSFYRFDLPMEELDRELPASAGGGLMYPQETIQIATAYDTLLDTLAQVLAAGTGAERMALRPEEGNPNVSDSAIAALRNLGVPMPAPMRVGATANNVPISEPTLRAVQAEIQELVETADDTPTDRGVFPQSLTDFPRAEYSVAGRSLPRRAEDVLEAIRGLCTGPDGALNEKMLRRVSAFANQLGTGCGYTVVVGGPLRPDIALMDGVPSTGPTEVAYGLNMASGGDVLLHIRYSVAPTLYTTLQQNEEVGSMALNGDKSVLSMEMDLRFDAKTCDPRLERLDVGYALVPDET